MNRRGQNCVIVQAADGSLKVSSNDIKDAYTVNKNNNLNIKVFFL